MKAYQLPPAWDPMRSRDEFLEFMRRNINSTEVGLVERAFWLAVEAHGGQTRFSGELYESHPVAVARMVMECLHIRDGSYSAVALLHDVLEDQRCLDERRIAEELGPDILDGVRTLTKNPRNKKDYPRQVREGGVRERIIKLCDKIHNMATVQFMPRANGRSVVANALRDYMPLALGLKQQLPLSDEWRAVWLHSEIERLCREHANL